MHIDIPGKTAGDFDQLVELTRVLNLLKQQNRTVVVCAEFKAMLPEALRAIAIESREGFERTAAEKALPDAPPICAVLP